MSDEIVNNLKKPSAWFRVLFMAGFAIALYVSGVILLVIMLAQIVFSLLTGEDNINLRRLGAGLASYVSQILAFLTYNSEQKPFPFIPFPAEPSQTNAGVSPGAVQPEAAQPEVVQPEVVQPEVVQPEVVQPEITPSADSQAVADDDGFNNPGAAETGSESATEPTSSHKRTTSRRKKTDQPEAPHTDD